MKYQQNNIRRINHGFTLIEVLMVMVLVAVLLGIGVPSFRTLIANQRLHGTSNDLRIALNLTRSEAVKRNRTVILTPTAGGTDWGTGWSIANPAGGANLLNHIQSSGVSISGPANIQFTSSGRSSAAEFEITNDGGSGISGCLTIQLNGRAVYDDGDC